MLLPHRRFNAAGWETKRGYKPLEEGLLPPFVEERYMQRTMYAGSPSRPRRVAPTPASRLGLPSSSAALALPFPLALPLSSSP